MTAGHLTMDPMDASGFALLTDVVPSAILEMRYYSTYNFIGDRIDGYEEPIALLTKEAARALKSASNELNVQGYRLKIFDAYRPATAVKHFMFWGIEEQDLRMKEFFYPNIDKEEVFERGYVAKQSSHSRGSAVDLTLLDMKIGMEVDMGGPFDLFDERSHPGYPGLTPEQEEKRALLSQAMFRNGFVGLDNEWWHFMLAEEPYPDTYFTFPVALSSLRA